MDKSLHRNLVAFKPIQNLIIGIILVDTIAGIYTRYASHPADNSIQEPVFWPTDGWWSYNTLHCFYTNLGHFIIILRDIP